MKIRAWFQKAAAFFAAHKITILGIAMAVAIGWLKYLSDAETVIQAVEETIKYLRLLGIISFSAGLIFFINKFFGKFKVVKVIKEKLFSFFKKQLLSLFDHVAPAYKDKAETLFVGLLVYNINYYVFDVVIYGLAVWYWGVVNTCLIMTPLTLFANWGLIALYDKKQKDYIGIEALKTDKFQSYKGAGLLGHMYRWIFKSQLRTFLYLTLRHDPAVATVFMREGVYQFNGMGKREFQMLALSTLIANVVWSARWGIVIWAGRLAVYVWQNPVFVISVLEKLNLFFFAN